MTQVKICGICDEEGARAAAEAGAELIGFHFCDSLRRVSPDTARAILARLPTRPRVVGVFIDQSPAEVAEIAGWVGLDLVQLHGSEPRGFPAPCPVMKVLKVRDGVVPDAAAWPNPILLDSWSADERGGTGRSWNWEAARKLTSERQVFFAGGLTPGNVAQVVQRYAPFGVDVSSGVESSVRVKDPGLVTAFVQAVKGVG